jgi:pimeloyl-ACP methyl ester carboxylesterase
MLPGLPPINACPAPVVHVVEVPRGGRYENADHKTFENLPALTLAYVELAPAERSRIRVEIALPPPGAWNGRLVGCGNGGGAGGLPTGSILDHARQGFAAVTTDMGTAPDPWLAGIDNPEVWKDYGHRATHLMTVVAKELVLARYGREPAYSYFLGGSTGGQQALSLAQRHPEDYDGILAAVPAHCRTPLHAYFLWNYQHTRRPDGSPLFTKKQEASYRAAALEYVSRRETFPHGRDRFIADPRWTPEDRAAVLRLAAARDPSLTPEQLEALRALQDGPTHARTGRSLFDGIPPATAFEPACGNLYLFHWIFGKDANLLSIDFDRDIDRYFAALSPDLDAEDTDLGAFRARGGKILMYSGTADSCVPYTATLAYYKRVAERVGSMADTQDFFLYYLLPGREHSGGPGVQFIENEFGLLRAWREKGVRPRATGRAMVEPRFTVPLQPYPECWGDESAR